MRYILLLTLLIALTAACSTKGAPNITADMGEFLSEKGLPNSNLKCLVLGNGVTQGPQAMCLFSVTDNEVATLVNQLGLQPKTDSRVSWTPLGPDCWTRLDFHDQSVAQWYISPDDDPQLTMSNGVQFSYFRLFYSQDKASGCISVAYPAT